jgi:hypothetical protein
MKILNRMKVASNTESTKVNKLQVVECMTTIIKAFSLSSEILFLSMDLLNRFLQKVQESESGFKDQASMNLAGLIIISLVVRYQDRISLNVAALAKLVNIDCTYDQELLRQLECNVLAVIGFKIYPSVLPTELIQKVA